METQSDAQFNQQVQAKRDALFQRVDVPHVPSAVWVCDQYAFMGETWLARPHGDTSLILDTSAGYYVVPIAYSHANAMAALLLFGYLDAGNYGESTIDGTMLQQHSINGIVDAMIYLLRKLDVTDVELCLFGLYEVQPTLGTEDAESTDFEVWEVLDVLAWALLRDALATAFNDPF